MAAVTTITAGVWSSGSTVFSGGSGVGGVPTGADTVTITHNIEVDVMDAVADAITINAGGTLRPSQTTNSKLVVDKGIDVGNFSTANLLYDMTAVPQYTAELLWNNDNDATANNTNRMSIAGNATFAGADKKYYSFSEGVLTGGSATQCYIDDATGWRAGDIICFAATQPIGAISTITNVTYNSGGGYLEITAAGHGLAIGDLVQFYNLQAALSLVPFYVSEVVSSSVFRVPSASVTVTDTSGNVCPQARVDLATIATITFDNAPTNTGRALVTWTDGRGVGGTLAHDHADNCVVGNLTRNVVLAPGVAGGKLVIQPTNSTYTRNCTNVLFREFNGISSFPSCMLGFTSGRINELSNCVFYQGKGNVQGSSNAGGGDFIRARNTYYSEYYIGIYAYGNVSSIISPENDLLMLRAATSGGALPVTWITGKLVNPLISGVCAAGATESAGALSNSVVQLPGEALTEGGAIWACQNILYVAQGAGGGTACTLSNTRIGIGPAGANYAAPNSYLVSSFGPAQIVLDNCPLYSLSDRPRVLGNSAEFTFLNKDEDPAIQEVFTRASYTTPSISRVTDTVSNSPSAIMMEWVGTLGLSYFRDFSVVVAANATETILIKARKNAAYGSATLPKAVVYDGVVPLSTVAMSDTADAWETLVVEITNANNADKQYRIRITGASLLNGAKCWFSGVPIAPFITKVRWYGYEFSETSAKRVPDVYAVASEAAASALTGLTLNNATKRISFGAGTIDTLSKLYDASRYWCVADVSRDIPFNRAGSVLLLSSGWTVVDPTIAGITWSGGPVEFNSGGVKNGSFDSCAFDFQSGASFDFSSATLNGTIDLYNNTGGSITVYVPAGTVTDTHGDTTIDVQAAILGITFNITPSGTDVIIATAGTEFASTLALADAVSTYTYNYTGTPTVDLMFVKAGYKVKTMMAYPLGSASTTVPIVLEIDRNYIP